MPGNATLLSGVVDVGGGGRSGGAYRVHIAMKPSTHACYTGNSGKYQAVLITRGDSKFGISCSSADTGGLWETSLGELQ